MRRLNHYLLKVLLGSFLLCLFSKSTSAQCPYNIDFETGTFDGWTCYTGFVSALTGSNVITLFPSGGSVYNRHTMYNRTDANGLDPYGGFPVDCPNGSGHSIRLGNDQAGGEAEGISYEFTIPAGQNIYSLIYHYAVVFQDPNHEQYQQPRMEIEIMNVTDNQLIECSSFTFIPYGSLLPGFFESPNPFGSTPVWCKDWSAVSINLDNMAGKTIRLFFKTADCTFVRHFGYAYIDVNSECTSEFVGASYCPDDTAINVTAPYGYQGYTWFNSNFTQVLGHTQTIRFNPPPPVGTTLAVELIPYDGYGCLDTLYAKLIDTLHVVSNAGKDTLSCNFSPVQIGANPKPGLVYSWSPVAGLTDPNIANPLANPPLTTAYVLTTRHDGGGCVDKDTVIVTASAVDDSLWVVGKTEYCIGSGDSAVLHVNPADYIQWYRDGFIIPGANSPDYKVTRTGTYRAVLKNEIGCVIATRTQEIVIDHAKPGIRYPLQYALINAPLGLEARNFGITAHWSPGISLNDQNSYTPVFTGPSDQLYLITIRTSTGCVTIDTQQVITVPSVEIFVPTAFTPNNNGLNDDLRPILMGVKQLNYFRIFNRWGQLVFETSSGNKGWDGNLSGIPQASQVYVWLAEAIGVDGKKYFRKGTSVLVR